MVTANEAESTLKTIRSLMERATIYRAISANTAILGGVLATALSLWGACTSCGQKGSEGNFILSWIIVCLFVSVVNAVVLHKQAWLRGDPFVSPGMKLALRGIIPPILCGVVITVLWPPVPLLVTLWMIFYGLALLSTQEFAPASIQWLGRAFVVMGMLTGLLGSLCYSSGLAVHDGIVFGYAAMGLSFGFFHLVYGISTLRTSKAELAEEDAGPSI